MASLYKRVGNEFLVNGLTANNQSGPHVARLPGGGFVIVWTDGSTIGDPDFGIRGQLFDAAGAKVGAEFLVNATIAGTQSGARVTALPSGRFVVTWTDQSATGGDTAGTAVRGQLFEANATPVGAEFLVNTAVAGSQSAPSVTGLEGGGFVIAWTDSSAQGGDLSGSGIKAQLFDAGGGKVGAEFLVNTTTPNSQLSASVIALAGGGFAIGWNETFVSNNQVVGAVRVQMFDAAGAAVGGERLVNEGSAGNFNGASLAALPSGFLVTWAQQDNPYLVTFDVRAQRYDAAGNKLGSEFVVNSTTAGSQGAPSAAALPGGGFIVTWQGPGEGAQGLNVYGQVYDAAGARVGVEFILSSVTDGTQVLPKVDVLASGDIVVTWQDQSGLGGDASGSAVKAEVLTLSTDAPTDISLSALTISETAREDDGLIALTTTGALNSSYSYELLSDSTQGGFRIEGDRLVVADRSKLDFETAPSVQLQIRSVDLNGNSFTETLTLAIADTPEGGLIAADPFLVNTTTNGNQTESEITLLASGRFVVSWIDWNLGGRAQVFDSDGNRVGSELAVEGFLAALPGGGFVAAGESAGGDGSYRGVAVRFFDDSGVPVGDAIPVNSTTAGDQFGATVAVLESGGFVVTWTDRTLGFTPGSFGHMDVRAQRFDAAGAKLGAEFLVNTTLANDQQLSQVVALDGGGFVIAWLESLTGGLRAQMYDANGVRLGTDFAIDTGGRPSFELEIAALPGGGFVIVFSKTQPWGDLSAQIFDSRGVRVGGELEITTTGPAQVASFDVAALDWGGFVVTWNAEDPAGAPIRAQVFDATGGRVGDELAVSQGAGDQIHATVAGLGSGGFIVGWSNPTADGSGFGINARIFDLSSPVVGTGADDVLEGTANADQISGDGGDDTINALGGNDTLDGGAGDDAMTGGTGNDVYVVDAPGDLVIENPGEGIDEVRSSLASHLLEANVEKLTGTSNGGQSLTGNLLDNVIAGGAGADILAGAAGNDIYVVGAGDTVVEEQDQGIDEVRTALAAYTLGANLENLTGTSSAGQVLTGNAAGNVITGSSGNDVLDGHAGDDSLRGGFGNDIYFVDSALDAVIDTGGIDEIRTALATYTLANGIEKLTGLSDLGQTLIGGIGSNTITGGGGDDVLHGDSSDTLIGGLGNDVYVIGFGTTLVENDNAGIDEIRTSFSQFTLGANFENLTGTASAFQALHGNAGNNVVRSGTGGADLFGEGGDDTLIGTAANEQFHGGDGADLMMGGGGFDFYFNVGAGDVVVEEADGGNDWVTTALAAYTLTEHVETLEGRASSGQALTGNAQANRIIGTDYNDVIDGGAGDDTLEGGFGDDLYFVDSAGDVINDYWGDNDEVRTGLANFTLGAGIERLTGLSAEAQALTGNDLHNLIDGGLGADFMAGGLGNDVYIVADAGDTVVELAGQGTDTVRTTLGGRADPAASIYVLPDEVENLVGTLGSAQQFEDNASNNVIVTTNGADFIYAYHGGNDTVSTGGGNDFLFFGAAFDNDDTIDAGNGVDRLGLYGDYTLIFAATALTGVERLMLYSGPGNDFDYDLTTADANVAAGAQLEVAGLSLGADETLRFNGAAETDGRFWFRAGAGDDVLIGGSQADRFVGGLGGDRMTGNGGADRFEVTAVNQSTGASFDTLVGFDASVDRINIAGTIASFTVGGSGALGSAGFDAALAALADDALGIGGATKVVANGGEFSGKVFVVVDADNDGVYTAGSDYVFAFEAPVQPNLETYSFFV